MGEQVLKQFLTFEEFQRDIISWSKSTFIRRVENENFPATKDGQKWIINRDKMELWFKKRGM